MEDWKKTIKDRVRTGKIALKHHQTNKGGLKMRTAHSILNRDFRVIPDGCTDVVKALRVVNNSLKLVLIVLLNIRTNQVEIGKAPRKIVKQQDGTYVLEGVNFPTLKEKSSGKPEAKAEEKK